MFPAKKGVTVRRLRGKCIFRAEAGDAEVPPLVLFHLTYCLHDALVTQHVQYRAQYNTVQGKGVFLFLM